MYKKFRRLAVACIAGSLIMAGSGPVRAQETPTTVVDQIVLSCSVSPSTVVSCVQNAVNSMASGTETDAVELMGTVGVCPTLGDTSCIGGYKNTGLVGPDQLLGANLTALSNLAARLKKLETSVVPAYSGVPTSTAGSGTTGTSTTSTDVGMTYNNTWCHENQCPPSSASIMEDGQIEPDGYCGPTSAANVLTALNGQHGWSISNIANSMGQYDNQGVGRGGWDNGKQDGSSPHWYGMAAINDYSEYTPLYNYYVWENLGSAQDLWYYAVEDIWGGVGPIFNIQDYGQGPDGSYYYPLPQYGPNYWPGHVIRHYFPAFGYYGSGTLQAFDENNFLSNHYWNISSDQMYDASYMIGNPQVLY